MIAAALAEPPTSNMHGISHGTRVMVHCYGSVSLSAAVVMVYLMRQRDLEVGEALDLLRGKRDVTYPNDGFRAQLRVRQESGYELWRPWWVSTRMRMNGKNQEIERSKRRLRKLGGAGDLGNVHVTLRGIESVKAPTEIGRINVSLELRSWKMAPRIGRLPSSRVVNADKLDESREPVILDCDEVASCPDTARHTPDLYLRESIL